MVLSRFERDEASQSLPQEWLGDVSELLNKTYTQHSQNKTMTFSTYGFSYADELLVIASWHHSTDINSRPVSYFCSLSIDENTKSEKIKKLLNLAVDSIGNFFDTYFSTHEWNEFIDFWQEAKFGGEVIFYKITRENIALTLEADQLLKQNN